MTVDLDIQKPMILFEKIRNKKKFIDRTEMISHLNTLIETDNKYICITSDERSGKTSMAYMIASYYSNKIDSKYIFEDTVVKKTPGFIRNLNNHNVIYMNMTAKSKKACKTYEDFICRFEEKLIKKLADEFPKMKININKSLWNNFNKIYVKTGKKFIFVIDEWDYILRNEVLEGNPSEYLKFMAEFLMGVDYAELVYITGEHPFSKYTESKAFEQVEEFFLQVV